MFGNRVNWACTFLKKAGLLQPAGHGQFQITDAGRAVLSQPPRKISAAFLKQFDSFAAFAQGKADIGVPANASKEYADESTPEDRITAAVDELNVALTEELLGRLKEQTWQFFEDLVSTLVVKMGYGGSERDVKESLRTGDEGIDGVINEDELGLDKIFLQAKRWTKDAATIGRPEIQKFVGALDGQHARKGIFVTTARFSKEAHDYVKHINYSVVLIDGEQLAKLMIKHDVGVALKGEPYKVKRIDEDFFAGEG